MASLAALRNGAVTNAMLYAASAAERPLMRLNKLGA